MEQIKGQHSEAEIETLRSNVKALQEQEHLSLQGQQMLQQYLKIIQQYDVHKR